MGKFHQKNGRKMMKNGEFHRISSGKYENMMNQWFCWSMVPYWQVACCSCVRSKSQWGFGCSIEKDLIKMGIEQQFQQGCSKLVGGFGWFSHSVGNVIIPTDELTPIFFRGVAKNHKTSNNKIMFQWNRWFSQGDFQLQSFVVDRTTPKTLRKPVGPEPQREDFPQENFRDKVIGGTSKLGNLHGFTWIYIDLPSI